MCASSPTISTAMSPRTPRTARRRTRRSRTAPDPRCPRRCPTHRIGSLRSCAMATATPPLAVPSSLVRTMPVTPAAAVNSRAWVTPFCPTVASSTSSVSCGAPGISRDGDAADLLELAHQVGARVQAAGGVDQDRIAAAGPAGLQRVEDHRRRDRSRSWRGSCRRRRAAPRPRAARPRRHGRCRRRTPADPCPAPSAPAPASPPSSSCRCR